MSEFQHCGDLKCGSCNVEAASRDVPTRETLEKSFRAAVSRYSATNAIPHTAASLAGQLLFQAGGDIHCAIELAEPFHEASFAILGNQRAEVDRLFADTRKYLADVLAEETSAQLQTG